MMLGVKKNSNLVIRYALLLISPFLSLILAIINWNIAYTKFFLVGAIVFLGITALPEGDLERYQSLYYSQNITSVVTLWNNFISFNEGKFYIRFFSLILGIFFNHHSVYFGVLYFIFGRYLVNFIFLGYNNNRGILLSHWGKFIFASFALFFSIRYSLNLAFYTGAIFIIYYLAKAILNSNLKLMWPIVFAPLFHFALAFLFIPILLFLFLKSKTKVSIILVLISYLIPQALVTSTLGSFANDKEGTLAEAKYESYVSENGMERLNKRYSEGDLNSNLKLSALNNVRSFVYNYLIITGLILLLWRLQRLEEDEMLQHLYNLILLLWAASNIMLNISNGVRFQIFHLTLAVLLFMMLYSTQFKYQSLTYFNKIAFPIIFILGIMSLYASNKFVSTNFYTSNYFIQIFAPTKYEQSN